jgi:hypothetical protein
LTAVIECLNLETAMIESFPRLVVRGSPPLAPAAGLVHVVMFSPFANADLLTIPARNLI